VVLENEECLDEREQQMHDVNEDENFAFACFCCYSFKVGSYVETIQGNAAESKG
jgi:hypothetical protein